MLEVGQITLDGTGEQLLGDDRVKRAYLGVETGSDAVLRAVHKGVTAEEMLEAGNRLREAGIDLWSFQNLISVFEKMHETIHGSILIISHQERILETADKIVVLVDGETRTIGTKDEIMPVLIEASSVCSRVAHKV